MDKYNIVYTNAAANDIAEKFQYITSVLHDRTTAERWYARLKDAIWHDLSFAGEVSALQRRAMAQQRRPPVHHTAGCCGLLHR